MRRRYLFLLVAGLPGCSVTPPAPLPSDYHTALGTGIVTQRSSSGNAAKAAKTGGNEAWLQEDRALRKWVKCARDGGQRVALVASGTPDEVAAFVLRHCLREQVAYERALKRMRISGPIDDVRHSLNDQLAAEISVLRTQHLSKTVPPRTGGGAAMVEGAGAGKMNVQGQGGG